MTSPEISCHPEPLLDGARSVVSAALCYWLPEPERPAGHGRLPRYTWHDGYAELREKLDALGRSLGAPYRVLVDANQHVDREAAARSGRRLLRQEHDADHAPSRLLGRARDARHDRRARADAARRRRLRLVHALHRRLPDRRARRARRARRDALPLVLDAGRRSRSPSPTASRSARRSTAATSARTSVPGTAASRAAGPTSLPSPPRMSTCSRGSSDGRGSTRSCCAPLRAAQRPALPAAERARRARERRAAPEHGRGARARSPRATTSCSPSTPAGRSNRWSGRCS